MLACPPAYWRDKTIIGCPPLHALVSDPGGNLNTRLIAFRSAAFQDIQTVGFHHQNSMAYPLSATVHFSGLNTGPVPSLHPAPDFRCRICLWISLPACRLRFSRVGLSQLILLSARASPAKRLIACALCDHPLGNIIEFHLPFVMLPTIRASLGARICPFDLLGIQKIEFIIKFSRISL